MPKEPEKVKPPSEQSSPSTGDHPSKPRSHPLPWLRLWTSYLHSAKVQRVTETSRARHINLLCVACEDDRNGRLPSLEDMAWRLRLTSEQMHDTLKELIASGLVEQRAKGYWIHDWGHWQFGITPAALRKRKQRAKHRQSRDSHATVTQESRPGHVTGPRARRADSDTETEKRNTALLCSESSPEASRESPAEQRARELAEINGRVRGGKTTT